MTKTKHNRIRLATITIMCGMAASSALAAGGESAQSRHDPLFLTITNAANNFLAVVNTRTREVDYVPTGGMGGAAGNAGGVAVNGKLAAAVNFGSSDVTIFLRKGNSLQPVQKVKTTSQPLSVAFGHDHLVVLGMTTAESFPVYGETIGPNDGIVPLFKADGSAGQIVTYAGGVVYSEKSGSVAQIALSSGGTAGLSGPSVPILLPAAPDNDTPYGLAARGANVYLAIAHSDLEALIVKGSIVSLATGPLPFKNSSGALLHAPCWNTLAGQFLYSADSPGKQILRYLVSDSHIFFDKAAAATFSGPPTDLDAQGRLMGVIDGGDGVNSNVSIFDIDGEGELTLRFALKIAGPINGAAILQ